MAIATLYRGIEYRSRLEARWAAFFSRLGWQFEYEPFDGDGYIPDFLIQGEDPLLVEVKPAVTREEYAAAITKVAGGLGRHWQRRVWIVGASPLPRWSTTDWSEMVPAIAGLLLEQCDNCDGGHHTIKEGCLWSSSATVEAHWAFNPREGIWSEEMSWDRSPGKPGADHKPWNEVPSLRPSSSTWREYESDLREAKREAVKAVTSTWAAATNDVKWRGWAA